MNYYKVIFCNEYSKSNSKFGLIRVNKKIDEYQLEDCKPFPDKLIDNLLFLFDGEIDDELADNQMMIYPWRLISEKLYKILKPYNINKDILFYPIEIVKNSELHKYYIMHFNKKLDVIDRYNSKMHNLGIPMRPKVFTEKLDGIHLFNYMEEVGDSFCVSDLLKEEMEKQGITGCHYQKIS